MDELKHSICLNFSHSTDETALQRLVCYYSGEVLVPKRVFNASDTSISAVICAPFLLVPSLYQEAATHSASLIHLRCVCLHSNLRKLLSAPLLMVKKNMWPLLLCVINACVLLSVLITTHVNCLPIS